MIWNANCDSSNPKNKTRLMHDLETWERAISGGQTGASMATLVGTQIKDKDFDRDGWGATHVDSFKDLIANARRTRKHAEDSAKAASESEARASAPVPVPVVNRDFGHPETPLVAQSMLETRYERDEVATGASYQTLGPNTSGESHVAQPHHIPIVDLTAFSPPSQHEVGPASEGESGQASRGGKIIQSENGGPIEHVAPLYSPAVMEEAGVS
jgi:hypothetical protein